MYIPIRRSLPARPEPDSTFWTDSPTIRQDAAAPAVGTLPPKIVPNPTKLAPSRFLHPRCIAPHL